MNRRGRSAAIDRLLLEIERAEDELVELAADLIRIPTVNPPGDLYPECAELIGDWLRERQFEVELVAADGRPEHTQEYPRVNVVGRRRGESERPCVHLNGHFDVVPVGDGWTVDPFAGTVKDGRLYGRGSADMKAGLASAMIAADCLRRAGLPLKGTVEVSGTVDEESGGFAGVAHLAETGRLSRKRTDHVIIPEPLDVDRVCLGHRGVYWFRVEARGRIAHGSMPFLGRSAIDGIGTLLETFRMELQPQLATRSTNMPVVPPEARRGSLNVNSVSGGQAGESPQTPCVADRSEAIFDRRFLLEEGFEATRAEIVDYLHRAEAQHDGVELSLEDLMVVHPILTQADLPLVTSLSSSIEHILDRRPELVASPGTYDHKHVARIAGIESCVAYGPGELVLAHQPDEYCAIDDMVSATKVMALSLVDLIC